MQDVVPPMWQRNVYYRTDIPVPDAQHALGCGMSAGHTCCLEKVHVMNRDQVHGRTQQFKGKLKEVAGRLVGDESLELEGILESTAGKVRSAYGDTKDRLRKRAF